MLGAPALKQALIKQAERRLEALRPVTAEKQREFQRVVGTALKHLVATELPVPDDVQAERLGAAPGSERLMLSRRGGGEQVPATLYLPERATGAAVVLVHPAGKAGLTAAGAPGPLVAGLLARGTAVLVPDVF